MFNFKPMKRIWPAVKKIDNYLRTQNTIQGAYRRNFEASFQPFWFTKFFVLYSVVRACLRSFYFFQSYFYFIKYYIKMVHCAAFGCTNNRQNCKKNIN